MIKFKDIYMFDLLIFMKFIYKFFYEFIYTNLNYLY